MAGSRILVSLVGHTDLRALATSLPSRLRDEILEQVGKGPADSTGPFKTLIENEALATMQQDLDKEKRAIQNQWPKREKQIEQAIGNTPGMYGDLQGIIGGSLPEIQGIDLLMLEAHA